jgi:thiamine biosynthesis lipoprotein
MACRFEIRLASRDAGCVPRARAALNDIDRFEVELTHRRVGERSVETDEELRRVFELWGELQRAGIEGSSGAAGRGFVLDRVGAGMRKAGVAHALLSAGKSNLLAVGGRGLGWQVDVESPRHDAADNRVLARVWLSDAAIATSSVGEERLAISYAARTAAAGVGVDRGATDLVSASVIATSAEIAGTLSKAFVLGGADVAARYCAARSNVVALITRDKGSPPEKFGSIAGARVEL